MARLRTFIAVPLERAIRGRAVSLQETLGQTGVDVKWAEPQNLHVTLLFLGEVDVRDTLDVCRAVSSVTAVLAPFSIRIAGVGCFPNPRRPRTIWAGISEGTTELVQLHDQIEAILIEQGNYRREDRPYTPHVTLGRVKIDGDTHDLTQALMTMVDWTAGTEVVREVHVLSSELGREGPKYTVLGRGKFNVEADE